MNNFKKEFSDASYSSQEDENSDNEIKLQIKKSKKNNLNYAKFDVKDHTNEIEFFRRNFLHAETDFLPKHIIRNIYLRFCEQRGLAPIGKTNYRKVIKFVFPDVKDRRIGPREKSVFHYDITLKQDSIYLSYLESLTNDNVSVPPHQIKLYSTEDTVLNEGGGIDLNFCHQEIEFLMKNFLERDSGLISKDTLDQYYMNYFDKMSIESLPSELLAKIIKHVFPKVVVRKIGIRTNNKFHYAGISLKPDSIFNDPNYLKILEAKKSVEAIEKEKSIHRQQEHISFLGDWSGSCLDYLSKIKLGDNELLPEQVTVDHIEAFEKVYKVHCQEILSCVIVMDLPKIYGIIERFWQSGLLSNNERVEESTVKELFHKICTVDCVLDFVRNADYTFYNVLLGTLMPDIVRPIPNTMVVVLRNFAKNYEVWMTNATIGLPEGLIKAKIIAANAFAQILKRNTSTNHLVQATRCILQDPVCVSNIINDLASLDFSYIRDQACMMTGCKDIFFKQIENEFQNLLTFKINLDEWTNWLDGIILHLLEEQIETQGFVQSAKKLALNWSFFSSLIFRELTLRGAMSLASFNLIRLLFDEYVCYLIEKHIAVFTEICSIAEYGNNKKNMEPSTNHGIKLEIVVDDKINSSKNYNYQNSTKYLNTQSHNLSKSNVEVLKCNLSSTDNFKHKIITLKSTKKIPTNLSNQVRNLKEPPPVLIIQNISNEIIFPKKTITIPSCSNQHLTCHKVIIKNNPIQISQVFKDTKDDFISENILKPSTLTNNSFKSVEITEVMDVQEHQHLDHAAYLSHEEYQLVQQNLVGLNE